MKDKLGNWIGLSCLFVTGFVIVLLFSYNLTVNPDYSFHLHEIWAVFKGFYTLDPYISGGSHILFKYGYIANLLGAALFPLLGKYTVAFLISASLPPLWLSAKKVFEQFYDREKARTGAYLVILNPLTISYVLASTLPFLWGVVFAFSSIYFFLTNKNWQALTLAIVAVFTHPLSAFLLISLLLAEPDYDRWGKIYSLPIGIFLIQLSIFFGLFSNFWTSKGLLAFHPVHYFRVLILALALAASYLAWERTRNLSRGGLIVLGGWLCLGLLGFWIPIQYFDRLGFLIFLLLIPLILKNGMEKLGKRQFLIVPLVIGISLSGVAVQFSISEDDDPKCYENKDTRKTIRGIVENRYVHYASDGSALYQLPKLENIKFSNAGKEHYSPLPENADEYKNSLLRENVSYVLVYKQSPEENFIEQLELPRVFSRDNIKIYELTFS